MPASDGKNHLFGIEMLEGEAGHLLRCRKSPDDEIEECRQAEVLVRQEPWTIEIERMLIDDRSSQQDGASSIARLEDRASLADAIEHLPERERLVLTLYHLEDLRLREIADVLKLSESRVSRLLSRAEDQLRQLVTSDESSPSAV